MSSSSLMTLNAIHILMKLPFVSFAQTPPWTLDSYIYLHVRHISLGVYQVMEEQKASWRQKTNWCSICYPLPYSGSGIYVTFLRCSWQPKNKGRKKQMVYCKGSHKGHKSPSVCNCLNDLQEKHNLENSQSFRNLYPRFSGALMLPSPSIGWKTLYNQSLLTLIMQLFLPTGPILML